MSQLKVNTITHTGASSDAITLASDGTATAKITGGISQGLSNRNMIINGEMKVSQRGTSHSFAHDGTASGYSLDRWRWYASQIDEWDWVISQDSSGPPGFSKSLKITTGTAESAVAANEYAYLCQEIEGLNLQRLGYGAGTAKTATFSFWVKSSQTGTFGFSIYRGGSTDRIVNLNYSISSANTWEKKTLSVPADTSDGITDDNSSRMRVVWPILAGTNFTSGTPSTSWYDYTGSEQYNAGHAQNGVATTASATWYLTGVQFELGDTATDYEYKSYGDELARCQRYYIQYDYTANYQSIAPAIPTGSAAAYARFDFPVEMRASPTQTENGVGNFRINSNATDEACNDILTAGVTTKGTVLEFHKTTENLNAYQGALISTQADNDASLYFDSEL